MSSYLDNLEGVNRLIFMCRSARGVLVPWPGAEPMAPKQWERSLNHWTAREVPIFFLQPVNFGKMAVE